MEVVTVVGWRGQGNFLEVVALEVFWKVPFTHLRLLLQEATPKPLTYCPVFPPPQEYRCLHQSSA